MPTVRIPQPASGGVMLSYKCSAACRHCMYACSPHWQGDWMGEQDLLELLTRLARTVRPSPWGEETISLNAGLHFTGGEPFLNFELLVRATEIAAELHIPSTFVETNCFWCIDDDETEEKLTLLKRKGLRGILISANPFYAEYVPFERTERCVRLSTQVFGPNVVVYQAEYYQRFKQLGIQERIPLHQYLVRTKCSSLGRQVELFLMGRAVRQLREFYPTYAAEMFVDEPCRPPFLRNWHNHYDNYGNVVAGYCGGISLGSWRQLERLTSEGIDLAVYPILGFLIAGDMAGFVRFAQGLGYEHSVEGYLSKCDLCLALRTYLVSVGAYGELSPRAFYTHLA